jgi:hypothetical protein
MSKVLAWTRGNDEVLKAVYCFIPGIFLVCQVINMFCLERIFKFYARVRASVDLEKRWKNVWREDRVAGIPHGYKEQKVIFYASFC